MRYVISAMLHPEDLTLQSQALSYYTSNRNAAIMLCLALDQNPFITDVECRDEQEALWVFLDHSVYGPHGLERERNNAR